MAKQGIQKNDCDNLLKQVLHTTGWALCIGAGTSLPIFPSWTSLVKRLVAKDSLLQDSDRLSDTLLSEFSPDSLIQAARDRFGMEEKDYVRILTDEMYKNLFSILTDQEQDDATNILSLRGPGFANHKSWKGFLSIADNHFSKTSAYSIADVIVEAIDVGCAPTAILSFNAEPLLFALINGFSVRKWSPLDSKPPCKGEMTQPLDLVIRSISWRRPDRIPYIFCHGVLPVPVNHDRKHLFHSEDKLVFSENEYLSLANNAFSWQSSAFIEVCGSRKVVFIGVSLSDPNIRRWLSWIHTNRLREIEHMGKVINNSTSHYWIRREPKDKSIKTWIESTVSHLGVRLIWIEDWSEIGNVLRCMLGLVPEK